MIFSFKEPICNETNKKLIANEMENGAFTHALLLEGEKGSGKTTLAKQIVCALACRGEIRPCLSCRDCQRILTEKCTDITYVGVPEDKKTIPVSVVRQIRADAYIIPGELEIKAYIIKEADKMTVEAQNAFLKILEEPPSYVYFILLCESSALLLPTVKSRTQNLRMEQLSNDTLEKLVVDRLPSAKKLRETDFAAFDNAVKSCKGSYGLLCEKIKALSLKKSTSDKNPICNLLDMLANAEKKEFFLRLSDIPSDREEYRAFIDSLLFAIRDITEFKTASGNSISIPRDAAGALSMKYSERDLIKLYDIVCSHRNESDYNTNINLSSSKLLLSMWETINS